MEWPSHLPSCSPVCLFPLPMFITDSLIYGHFGLHALRSPQTRPLNGNSRASLLGVLRPLLCPWRKGRMHAWPQLVPALGAALRERAPLGIGLCCSSHKGRNYISSLGKNISWAPTQPSSDTRQEMRHWTRTLFMYRAYSLPVIKIAFLLWQDAWQEIFFKKFFINKDKNSNKLI